MMKYIFFSCLIVLVTFNSCATFAQEGFNNQANDFFAKYVSNGKVDYDAVHNNTEALDQLVEKIANYKLSNAENDFPFYLNAYNLLVIHQIDKNYPTDSPLSVDGFFDKMKFKVAGSEITLNHIENEIIRPTYKDARIHFALVCAAVDCPKLTNEAFSKANINQKLDSNTKKAMNDANFIRFDGQSVQISKIFEWYKVDFGGEKESFLKFINQYRETSIPTNTPVDFYEYDWSLNKK